MGVYRLEVQKVRKSAIPLLVAEVCIADLGGSGRHEFQGRHGRSPPQTTEIADATLNASKVNTEKWKNCNCSGQFVIRICRTRHDFDRFRVFHHSNRDRADLGARVVPVRLNESSEAA